MDALRTQTEYLGPAMVRAAAHGAPKPVLGMRDINPWRDWPIRGA